MFVFFVFFVFVCLTCLKLIVVRYIRFRSLLASLIFTIKMKKGRGGGGLNRLRPTASEIKLMCLTYLILRKRLENERAMMAERNFGAKLAMWDSGQCDPKHCSGTLSFV